MAEYGGFVLSSRKRFKKLSELIIALMLYLEDSTDEDSRSENDENDSDEEGDNEDEDMEVDDMGEEDESSDSDWLIVIDKETAQAITMSKRSLKNPSFD